MNGSRLHGWWFGSDDPGPAALVIHGWGGQASDMLPVADVMRGLGLNVLLLDARGHGSSDGISVASMPSFADDVRAGLGGCVLPLAWTQPASRSSATLSEPEHACSSRRVTPEVAAVVSWRRWLTRVR